MFNEKMIEGLNPGDRVFEKDGALIKVRLQFEPVMLGNKIHGPGAFRLHLSAAVCDENGKAIPRTDGTFCILPHTITLGGLERPVGELDPFSEIDPVLENLIDQAIAWHSGVRTVEEFLKNWQDGSAPMKKREVLSPKEVLSQI